jgi:hypothetical protein
VLMSCLVNPQGSSLPVATCSVAMVSRVRRVCCSMPRRHLVTERGGAQRVFRGLITLRDSLVAPQYVTHSAMCLGSTHKVTLASVRDWFYGEPVRGLRDDVLRATRRGSDPHDPVQKQGSLVVECAHNLTLLALLTSFSRGSLLLVL